MWQIFRNHPYLSHCWTSARFVYVAIGKGLNLEGYNLADGKRTTCNFDKLLPSQPAFIYHGGRWLCLPVPPARLSRAAGHVARTIDCPASADHRFQPSWVGTALPLT